MALPHFDRGLIIVPPHGALLAAGAKTVVIKSRPFRFADGGRRWTLLVLTSAGRGGSVALARCELSDPVAITVSEFETLRGAHRITDAERRRWWPGRRTLYAYRVQNLRRLRRPVAVQYGRGPQVTVTPERVRVVSSARTS